jgi:methyl-accepting chemotaxis protein
MQAFNRMKVGQRLALGFAALVLLLATVAGLGAWKLRTLNGEVEVLVEDRVPKLRKAGDWMVSVLQSARHARNALIMDEKDQVAAELEALKAQRAERSEIIKWLGERVVTEAGRAALKGLEDERAAYVASEERFVALVQSGDLAAAKAQLLTDTRPKQLEYIKGIDAFIATQQKLVDEQAQVAGATYRSGLVLIAALAGGGLLLAIGVGLALTRSITRQLGAEPDEATAVAQRIAAGDLSGVITLRAGDQTSLMAAMKAMNDSLARVVADVRGNAENVSTASQQIAQGNADLSQRTEEQASSLQQTAATMEQLGTTVKQNADNAQQANQLAQGASAVAIQGGEVVGQVVQTMKGISDSSKRIADIIGTIDGIAFQTNILALNAAVEAARAGEQGRGFAVVAAEVRSLAQRSAEAAKEIKSLISASVERVEQGTTLVDQAGRTMDQVVASIRRVTDIMGEISAASVEQNAGVQQVGQAVGQMDQVTQQNAALVEESAAAAESLKGQAVALVNTVGVFKLVAGT